MKRRLHRMRNALIAGTVRKYMLPRAQSPVTLEGVLFLNRDRDELL
jgi:hypothetical protein